MGDLPNRTNADVDAAALVRGGDDDYQTYNAFIRNAAYDAARLNAFVGEIAGKINQKRDIDQVNA